MAVADGSDGRGDASARMLGYVLLALGIMAAVAATKYVAWRASAAVEAAVEPFPIETEVALEENGIAFESRFGFTRIPWTGIQDMQVLPEHFAIIFFPYQVVLVPNRAFPVQGERDRFVHTIRERIA